MKPLKVAVLVDRDCAQLFAVRALDSLRACDEVSVFSCTNTHSRRQPLRHCAYYALNLLSIRNPLTRLVPIGSTNKRIAERLEFASEYEGAWQALPAKIVARLQTFDAVVKMGLGLLRVPEALTTPILSWHHGDPARYRGRPAGFWEMLHGEHVMGQMIQVVGDKLDEGSIVAFAETKIHPQSYRKTLIEAYRHSHLLLNEAIDNALAHKALAREGLGKNYRLPSNRAVLKFVGRMALRWASRVAYGGFIEKSWKVSLADTTKDSAAAIASGASFPPSREWRTLATPREYVFLADPFFSRQPPGILAEALRRSTSLGEIVFVEDGECHRVSAGEDHLSYPSTIEIAGGEVIVPEMEQAGEARCYRLRNGRMEEIGKLKVEGSQRLIDPTLFWHEGNLYLFANDADQGSGALMLWSAPSLFDRFQRHPASPILISPRGARMAGAILPSVGLTRFGQNLQREYGDGVFIFHIDILTPEHYRERRVGEIRFKDRRGPHTLNFDAGRVLFDWYTERLSALAGFHRARARLRIGRRPRSR